MPLTRATQCQVAGDACEPRQAPGWYAPEPTRAAIAYTPRLSRTNPRLSCHAKSQGPAPVDASLSSAYSPARPPYCLSLRCG